MHEVVIDAYRREFQRLLRQDRQREQRLLDALLEGRAGDPEFAETARSELGISPEDRVACAVALLDDATADEFGPVEDRLDRAGVQARWHVRLGTYYALLSGDLPDEAALVAAFDASPCRVGVARSSDGVAGFAGAYQLAPRAAETLPRLERGVVAVRHRLPEVLLAGSPPVVPPCWPRPSVRYWPLPEPHARRCRTRWPPCCATTARPPTRQPSLLPPQHGDLPAKQIEELSARTLADPRDKMLLGLAVLATGRD